MRADFDFWKHVTYTLVFLTPMAVYALIAASKRFGKTQVAQTMIAITTVLLLASGSAWAGKSTVADRVTFWPNVEPIISYFEGRLPNNARILTDDSVLRYYFNPLLSQSQIVDPFYVNYKGVQGSGAYSRAVEDGAFDYVILDGGMGAEAQAMHSALWGHMGSYTRVLKTLDPSLGREIDIFQRTTPPAALLSNTNPSVEITAPATESQVASKGAMSGKTAGAGNGWYVRLEVLTDRWYSLGKHPLRSDGTFQTEVNFAGEGYQACHHMLRARLYDAGGNPRAVSVVFNLKRADTPCQ